MITLPVVPLRDSVIYPFVIIPIFINHSKLVHIIEDNNNSVNKQMFFVAQKDVKIKDPKAEDLYDIGTIANVMQVLKLADGTIKILLEGVSRGKIKSITTNDDAALIGEIELLKEEAVASAENNEIEMLVRTLLSTFGNYVRLNTKIPLETLPILPGINEPGRLADVIAAHLPLVRLEERQKTLETQDIKQRLQLVINLLAHEFEMFQVEEGLKVRVKSQLDKAQKEFYLNEKLKAVQKELDAVSDGRRSLSDTEKLNARIEDAGFSKEAKEKALVELNKLKLMPPMSAEATVSRNYLDWLLDMPWKQMTEVNKNLIEAEKILENGHYGLEKIKERITEYLAVQNRMHKVKGPILCLVGPPGVGKTSLGQSIARATGREFVRISLGGVRDEAEIRGHRRTYIGALPGKILQKMAKAKVRNPLFMLDEVDKMAMDFRGDPASALLEVLDPEQNHAFNDHYLEVDYDLSDVMFIATANSLDIPHALLDRLEVLRIAGYTEDEKLHIAIKYVIPKQIKESGLTSQEITFTNGAITEIIRYYTREAGVRNLEREIAKICRKVVKKILIKPKIKKIEIIQNTIEKYLGVKIYHFGLAENKDQVGQVTGLAWTEAGGDLLTIEVAVVPGKGKTIYTGRLGEVMQESIHAALTVVRSRSVALGIKKNFYETSDLHVHVPEGATPKDGPSAGVGMCIALISALTHIPARADVAMTGEITLRGEILPIGGLKEKLLAALRGGIKTVIIPDENAKDLKELPKNITQNLNIIPVKQIDQVLKIALKYKPNAIKATKNDRRKKQSLRTSK